ncbi:hypothetical protein P3T27_007685 [Kitasatospora sp. MAA19]|uniref:hypothetical protein n=1 Tax=unclassified Kitasatospora TaxID=2633591 RepID=UPI002473B3D7|nr:hypothetical protein [Kitasatospora sp. MAA19]MDH6710934.1 hypothetical protein [Kitasatospora sp. MAA19]
MESEPVRNNGGEVALFELDGDQVEGARCEGPDCEEPLPPREGRGRRLRYHSQACKSRADRARAKARTTGVPAPAAGAPGGEQAAEPQPDQPLPGQRQQLLDVADAVRLRTDAFLAAVDDDPQTAYAELARVIPALSSLLLARAQEVWDAAHPGAARTDGNTNRGDFPAPSGDAPGAGETPRGETPAEPSPHPGAGNTPRGENTTDTTGGTGTADTLAAADANAPLRTAVADPYARFGRPDRLDDLAVTFGAGWELAIWSAPGVELLLHDGTPQGWTCRLPDGPWGVGGWIAVQHLGDGRPGRFVADHFGRPQTYDSADLALDVFHRAAAPAAPPTPAEPDGMPVPDLALGAATGWTPPTLRGLGDPRRDYALGGGLVHLTWPGRSDVQALEQRGRLAGWTEVYDNDGSWIALINGHPVADAADNLPLLSTNPNDALTLLRLALERDLGSIPPGWVLPRPVG